MLAEEMLKKKIWAVVGANQDPAKYGNMIYRKLKRKNCEVFAVNPNYDQIEGDKCYPTLASLPQMPEVVNFVVSPRRTKAFLEEAAGMGIKYVWFQPGTHDDENLKLADDLGLEYVLACVLVATR